MKMLMIIVDKSKREELEVFLRKSGVAGYTEVPEAAGLGSSGMRLGSGAFPKTSAVIFTMLPEQTLERLRRGIDSFCATCGEEVRMVAWDIAVLR